MSGRYLSPLRYPGGKARMATYLSDIFTRQVGLMDVEVWAEPFAGGAGAGLGLLMADGDCLVEELWLCETNPALAAFWRVVTTSPADLAGLVHTRVPTLDDFYAQQAVLADPSERGDLDLAWAAFVVNRCSRSGIIAPNVGPIGGRAQTGKYGISARWNGEALARRIEAVGRFGGRITIHEGNAVDWIGGLDGSVGIEDEMMLFVDPPYIGAGPRLYTHGQLDHDALARVLHATPCRWLLTYDHVENVRELYPHHRRWTYPIPHRAAGNRLGMEVAVASDNLDVGDRLQLLPEDGAAAW